MFVLVAAITSAFACVAFIWDRPQGMIFNPLYTYYIYVLRFIAANLIVFATGFFTLVLGWWLVMKKLKTAVVQAVWVSVIGWLLSAVMIFIIAVIELNILAVLVNINPKSVGVESDRENIVRALTNSTRPPEIFTSDPGGFQQLLAVAIASTGKANFYGSTVLPAVPKWLVVPIRRTGTSMMLVDNTLIASEITHQDLQAVSPVLGYRLVKQIFANRTIKATPEVTILSSADYLQYRQREAEANLVKLEAEEAEMTSQIRETTVRIGVGERAVTDAKGRLNLVYRDRESEYQKCVMAGLLAEPECKTGLTSWDERVTQANAAVNEAMLTLEGERKSLKDNESYLNILTTQKGLVKVFETNIPREFGHFVPDSEIKMVVNAASPQPIADYLATLTHEYLHYASFVSDRKILNDPFFEEGLTEYFARKAIANNLQVATNVGYPVAVKIIGQMSKRIPESELADIYFSKDQAKLQTVLERVYGDNFYKQNRIVFTLLMYTSDEIQSLKLANTLMERIGGAPLKINDLLSSPSDLRNPN